jgi:hypothetical protein
MTTGIKAAVWVAIILFLTPLLWAGGGREKPSVETPTPEARDIRLLLAYPRNKLPERMVRERFDLAASVALTSWTPFLVEASGRLRYEASGQYSGARERARYEDRDGWLVFEYTIEPTEDSASPSKVIQMRFSVADLVDGDRLDQPAAFAVQRAATQSGITTGRVRLQSLRYTGRGRFTAVVALLE